MGRGLKLAKVGKAKKRAFYGNVAAATAPAASEKDVLELKLKLQQQSQQSEKLGNDRKVRSGMRPKGAIQDQDSLFTKEVDSKRQEN